MSYFCFAVIKYLREHQIRGREVTVVDSSRRFNPCSFGLMNLSKSLVLKACGREHQFPSQQTGSRRNTVAFFFILFLTSHPQFSFSPVFPVTPHSTPSTPPSPFLYRKGISSKHGISSCSTTRTLPSY